jgi:hypothetical protein
MTVKPGLVVLFGSGEASPEGRQIHEHVVRHLRPPIRACVLETPAGFELNSSAVAGKLASFLEVQLQNHHPTVTLIPARRRSAPTDPESTDNPAILAPILRANYLMMGPGSPTYAVRHLADSLAWRYVVARHRLGYPLVFASAVAISIGRYVLPVYEIYKVGDDPHWKPGLDLLGPYGIAAAFVPHWDNTDGGADLDTSRCFIGRPRFERLLDMLPTDTTVVGIDEKTALVLDLERGVGRVMGRGTVTVVRHGASRVHERQTPLDLSDLGDWRWPEPTEGLPDDVWAAALAAESECHPPAPSPTPPEVTRLAAARAAARTARDFAESDRLRREIANLGWQVNDTHDGYELLPLAGPAPAARA